MVTKKTINELTYRVIGAAIEVHKAFGPGLTEEPYESALVHELQLRGIRVTRQQNVLLNYKGVLMDCKLRYDLLVEDLIVCELKAVTETPPLFDAVLMTYMKILKKPKGLLFNFHVLNLQRDGLKSFVNEYFTTLPDE